MARERLGVSIAGDEYELKVLRERVADLEVEASGLAADLSTARSATYVQRLAGEAERARRGAKRLREAAHRLLAVAAAAIRDGEPLHPDAVPEFDDLARAALAAEGKGDRGS